MISVTTRKPRPPIILSVYESDLKLLEELAHQKGMVIAEIFHQALALYLAVSKARTYPSQTRILVDKGAGNHFELVLPF